LQKGAETNGSDWVTFRVRTFRAGHYPLFLTWVSLLSRGNFESLEGKLVKVNPLWS